MAIIEIKKLKIFSMGKFGLFIGFLFGLLNAFILLIVGSIAMMMIKTLYTAYPEFLGFLATINTNSVFMNELIGAVILIVICAIAGFFGGMIFALLYNLYAWVLGGVKVETVEKE